MNGISTKAAQGIGQHQPQIIVGEMLDRLADDIDNHPYCARPDLALLWENVGNFAVARCEAIGRILDIRTVDSPPYDTKDGAQRMFADIANGVYYVQSFANNNPHPYWECPTWKAFRTVHDIDGHIPAGADFTIGGEEHTFKVHVQSLPFEWRPVIFSETLFEVASTNRNHRFPQFHKALFSPVGFEAIARLTGTWREPATIREEMLV